MKLLKRQKGLPFLLTLGVLLVLSASFLAVQLWSGNEPRRGAVEALEAPVMPPTAPTVVAAPAAKKNAAKIELAVPVEPEIVKTPEAPEEPEIVKEPELPVETKAVEQSPVTSVVKAPEKETSAAEVKAARPAKKKAKKSRKKVVVVEEIPTEIPVEWNWFSKPLKLDLTQGTAQIVASEDNGEVVLDKVIPSEAEVAAMASASVKVQVEAVESETEKPFAIAIARMVKIRQMHEANAAKRSAVVSEKPAEKPASAEVMSPSMRRMGEMLRLLSEKLDRKAVVEPVVIEKTEGAVVEDNKVVEAPVVASSEEGQATEMSAVADTAVVVSDKATSKIDNVELKPYRGSGSSFSNRVNEMIKSGSWLKE